MLRRIAQITGGVFFLALLGVSLFNFSQGRNVLWLVIVAVAVAALVGDIVLSRRRRPGRAVRGPISPQELTARTRPKTSDTVEVLGDQNAGYVKRLLSDFFQTSAVRNPARPKEVLALHEIEVLRDEHGNRIKVTFEPAREMSIKFGSSIIFGDSYIRIVRGESSDDIYYWT